MRRAITFRINHIMPLIHRIVLTSEMDFRDLMLTDDLLKWKVPCWHNDPRMKKYRSRYRFNYCGQWVEWFTDRRDIAPMHRIEVSGPSIELLVYLCRLFPDMRVSTIEFAIDFHFRNSNHVRGFYRLLKHYLYIKRARRIRKSRNGKILSNTFPIEESSNLNNTFYIAKGVKIYERGPDNIKRKVGKIRQGWDYRSIDRVRLEFTLWRRFLRKEGINTLEGLLQDWRFAEVVLPRLLFMRFKKDRKGKLPMENESYALGGQSNAYDSFQYAYAFLREKGIVRTTQIIPAKGFENLVSAIKSSIDNRKAEWDFILKSENWTSRIGKRQKAVS